MTDIFTTTRDGVSVYTGPSKAAAMDAWYEMLHRAEFWYEHGRLMNESTGEIILDSERAE